MDLPDSCLFASRQTVRWKPPPPRNDPNDPHIGWRTEFRSMEIQLTDFENAAFTVFIVLLTRVILTFDLNFYIPMSRVDANMQRAHSRNAAAKGKFFFRRHLAPLEEGDDGFGVKYVSMFARAVNGGGDNSTELSSGSSSSLNSTDVQTDVDGVSSHRKNAPCAPGSEEENAFEEMTMEGKKTVSRQNTFFLHDSNVVWLLCSQKSCAAREITSQALFLWCLHTWITSTVIR